MSSTALSHNNIPDVNGVHLEVDGYRLAGNAFAEHLANLGNLVVGQLSCEVGDHSSFEGMIVISEIAGPFEVNRDGVASDAIDVVDLRQVLRVWNESHCDKSVHLHQPVDGFVAKVNDGVAVPVQLLNHYSPVLGSRSSTWDWDVTVETSDVPVIADLVKLRQAFNVNGFPFLGKIGDQLVSLSSRTVTNSSMAQCH